MNVTDLIKDHEGLRSKPYLCTAGRTSIGFGRNLDDLGIRPDEAEYMLANDIHECRVDLIRAYSWFLQLDEVRQAALIDLRFNLGQAGLAKFVRFLAAMTKGDYEKAGAELVASRWYSQVGRRGPRVVKMVKTGEWP